LGVGCCARKYQYYRTKTVVPLSPSPSSISISISLSSILFFSYSPLPLPSTNCLSGAGKGVFATAPILQLQKIGTFWGYKNSKTNIYDPEDDTKYEEERKRRVKRNLFSTRYSSYAAGIPTIDPADPETNQVYPFAFFILYLFYFFQQMEI